MLGPHVNRDRVKKGPLVEQVKDAVRQANRVGFRMGAYQIFIAGPQNTKINVKPGEAIALAEYNRETGLRGVAHNTYVSNIWTGPRRKFYTERIDEQIAIGRDAGLVGFVIHLPAKCTDKNIDPYDYVVDGLKDLQIVKGIQDEDLPSPTIFLEIPSTRPENACYNTPAKLNALWECLQEKLGDNVPVGFCVDTAHLWSSGVDVASRENAEEWLNALAIPPARLMFHLNDSQKKLGGGSDSHDAFFAGQMWGPFRDCPSDSGLAAFVEFIVEHDCTGIFERKADLLVNDYEAIYRLQPSLRLHEART